MYIIIIILIILVISLIFSIIHISNSKHKSGTNYGPSPIIKQSITKDDILNLYNDTSFNDEDLPNGGLLISMISNGYALGGDIKDYPGNKKCYSIEDIIYDNIPDFNDITKLLYDTAMENSTNCTSLDTTYIRYDAPGILFGPVLNNNNLIINMSIGLILDINKLKKYIGCLFISDSGSDGRYNTKDNFGERLNDDDFDDYNKLIRSKKGQELANCGCGLSYGVYSPTTSGIYNGIFGKPLPKPNNKYLNWWPITYSDNKFTPKFNDYISGPIPNYNLGVLIDKDYNLNSDDILNLNPTILPNGQFNYILENGMYKTISINNKKHNITNFLSGYNSKWQQPYSKNSFKYFINQIRNKYKDIFRVFNDIDKYYYNLYYQEMYNVNAYDIKVDKNSFINFYYENEVDIYVPNKEGSTRTVPWDTNPKSSFKCDVTDKFKEVWKDCVIGIFTNHRCAENIIGSSFQMRNNKTYDTINKNNINDFSDQLKYQINNGNMKLLGEIKCDNNSKCCCSNNNYAVLDNLVIQLVKKYNSNLKSGQKKINGYIMNDDMHMDKKLPNDFNKNNITKQLKIKQITNY